MNLYIMHTPETYSALYVSVVLTSETIPPLSSGEGGFCGFPFGNNKYFHISPLEKSIFLIKATFSRGFLSIPPQVLLFSSLVLKLGGFGMQGKNIKTFTFPKKNTMEKGKAILFTLYNY